MKNKISLLLLVFCALAVSAYSQTERQAADVAAAAKSEASPPAAEAKPLSTGGKVTVYVYRYKAFVGGALEPAVFVNDKKVAAMDNGRWFKVVLPPGKHTFQSNDKQSGIELDLKEGEEYYIRVDIATGFWKGHGRLTLVQKEQGGFEIKKLKPIDKNKLTPGTVAETEEEAKS